MNKKKILSIGLAVGGVVLLAAGLIAALSPGRAPGNGEKVVEFEVKQGTSPGAVVKDLASEGLLNSPDYFRWLLRMTGRTSKMKAGIYELNDGMSAGKIADILTEGRVRMLHLTIPEGWTNRQIADYFAEKSIVSSKEEFLKLAKDKAVLAKYKIPADTTEGYLFPDTYSVPMKYPADKIQELMIKHFFELLHKADPPAGIDPTELHHKVILASIVEREAVRPDERPMMAQVFLNRLDKKMRLESCATIQYLLPKPRARLYDKDLQIESPYNTYKHAGFPPGPVSNPGLPALTAAFHPKASDHLYFVLKPDGSHHFSLTYKEHVDAKKQYLGH
ncbi:MAG: endolytic transglycosylase MltG [Spirochaetia bacterium]|nr:endolytic transglycosylase MltG [Spirochaetia bacterium]